MKNKQKLAILNLIGLIFALVLNGMANGLPMNGKTTGELSDAYPNLFVPAGFTFAIWGIIYLGLTAFVVYQLVFAFSKKDDSSFIEEIGIWFFVSCLANGSWIVAWHYQYVFISLIIMLAILFSLIKIYENLQIGIATPRPREKWLVYVPFSIYLGWITVATIANVTTLFVHIDWNGFGIAPELWTMLVISVGTLITLTMLNRRRDIPYSLVVIWAYYGIISKRMALDADLYQNIILTAQIGIGLILLTMLYKLVRS